ncbi:FHY3/FAR1 family protein, partial [Dioscorea alata]
CHSPVVATTRLSQSLGHRRRSGCHCLFQDEEEAFRFYLDYANSRGFGIRRGHMYRSSKSQLITCRHFVCDKEGSKCMKDKRQLEKTVHRHRDTRTNCQARMVVSKMKSGLWTIKTFGDAHNPDLLTSPSKVMKIRSHRRISDTCRRLTEALHKSRVGLSQMSRILNETLSNTGTVRSNNIGQKYLAMGKAIAKVFPNSGHRLCSWHIGRNSLKYLEDLKSKEGFMGDYNNWLHHSQSIEAFESKWGEVKATYNIDDKHWLSKMYEIRHKWVFLYWKNIFTAGMTSTQRSESISSFFDGFVNSQTPLDEFTLNSMPNFDTVHPIERHAGEVYTRAMFNIFQAELRESDSMLVEKCIRDGTDHAKYKICNHSVIFRRDGIEDGEPIATCSCKKFETEGEVAKIPKNYIVRRWSMAARYRSNVMMVDTMECTKYMFRIAQSISSLEMYDKIMPKLNDIFKMVGDFSSAREYVLHTEQSEANEEIIGSSSFPTTSCGDDVCGSHISILDPIRVKSKGRPKVNTRIKSGIDIQLSLQKKRTCSRCGRKGHYMSTCTFTVRNNHLVMQIFSQFLLLIALLKILNNLQLCIKLQKFNLLIFAMIV